MKAEDGDIVPKGAFIKKHGITPLRRRLHSQPVQQVKVFVNGVQLDIPPARPAVPGGKETKQLAPQNHASPPDSKSLSWVCTEMQKASQTKKLSWSISCMRVTSKFAATKRQVLQGERLPMILTTFQLMDNHTGENLIELQWPQSI